MGELEPPTLSPTAASSSSSPALRPRYKSVNACLLPLIAAHGSHILTIEGLGTSSKPHALQERFGKAGWFQCSACASGIIMAFYAQLRGALEEPLDLGFERASDDGMKKQRGLTEKEVEEGFDGNLCRCTGYRCLLDVAKTFAVDYKPLPNILIESSNEGVDGHGTNGTDGHANGHVDGDDNDIDPDVLAKKPEDDIVPIKEATAIGGGKGTATGVLEKDRQPGAPVLCGKGSDCCKNKPGSGCNGNDDGDEKNKPKTIPGIPVFSFKPYSPDAEPIFPPWLKKYQGFRGKDLVLVQKRREPVEIAEELDNDDDSGEGRTTVSPSPLGNVWLRPGSLASLIDVMRRYPGAKIRSGNTETGIEVRFKASRFAVSVYVSDHIRDLATIRTGQEGLHIGSALSLSDLVKVCKGLKVTQDFKEQRGKVMVLDSILDNLQHFASNQIRNVACLAGNITTASPISDLNPIWVATGATLKYVDAEDTSSDVPEEKSVNMRDFFLGYRKTALPRGAVVTNLFVPLPGESADGSKRVFTRAYKQSKRKDDDIAIVTCCLRIEVEDRTITDVRLVYGGMAPTTVESKETQAWLTGKQVGDDAAFYGALERLSGVDFPLQYGVPGGMAVYRKSLAMGFFAKFWAEVTTELGVKMDSERIDLSDLLDSEIHRGLCTGKQDLEDVVLAKKAGQSIPHLAHLKHVTGEAQYCDDIPRQHNELIGALVFSQKPHAKILSIDSEVALEMDGVHDFVTVKDLPGSNIWNPPAMDEVLFAEDEVFTCGQVIGVVLAETKNQAQAAARAIKVEYEELPYILTIDEAIAADSFFKPRPKLERGDISKIDQADHVLEGWWRMGGQEQFYIETNATLAIPHPEDEMEVFSSTQNPSETQVFVASGNCFCVPEIWPTSG
jgi:xanthine dehydrogenase/oxidase